MLEYWTGVTGTDWCYSPAAAGALGGGAAGYRDPAVPACTLYYGRPPLPGPFPYRVRVTVSSTHESFFATAVGRGNSGPTSPQADATSAACTRAGDGLLTCAQAVGLIAGTPHTVQQGPVVPITICDGDVERSGVPPGNLYQLWGNFASPNICNYRVSAWQGVVDFSRERDWCDDPAGTIANTVNGNIDYTWSVWSSLPLPRGRNASGDISWPAGCGVETSYPETWRRSGFQEGPYTPTGDPRKDVPYWIANPMGGVIRVGADGNKLPTYCNLSDGLSTVTVPCGNMGNNVARGFYCTGGGGNVTDVRCEDPDTNFTYFFAQNQPGFQADCPDATSNDYRASNPGARIGCRDASVVTWDSPEQASPTTTADGDAWEPCRTGTSGPRCVPNRVRAQDILMFRFYCVYDASGTRCINPAYGTANSLVYGRFMGPFIRDCPTCTTGVTIYGDTARLVQ